jgi:CheY-like chemotaxis protein
MEDDLLNRKPLIFIVDDDEDDLYFIKSAISNTIPESIIKSFLNGKQLLDHLNKLKNVLPSFILLDLNMPVLNGKETLRQIRQNNMMSDMPVVIFSTSNNAKEKSLCFEYGASNYFCKPACIDDYNDIVLKLKLEYIERTAVS